MELKKEVESLLFSSGKVMTEQELAELTNSSIDSVKEALKSLKQEYDERDTSLMLVQSDDKWKLNVREKYMNLVTKIVADTELPFPVLETLAVIAYKAPVLQSEIIKIRGTNAYEHIGELAKEDFVEKKKEGRSFRLSLTSKFFKYFDVEGESDIKEALKDVKVLEKKTPERVGMLKVVDVPPEEEKEEGEEAGEEEKTTEAKKASEPVAKQQKTGEAGEEQEEKAEPEEKRITIDEHQPDHGFIQDIDKRIGELRERNDEVDQDDLFKRQEELNKEQESSEKGEEDTEESDEKRDEDTEEKEEEKEEENGEDEEKGTEGVQEEIQKIMKDLKEEKEKIEESHKEISEGLLEEKEEGGEGAEEEKEEKEEEPVKEEETAEEESEEEKEAELKAELKKEAQEIDEELKKGKS